MGLAFLGGSRPLGLDPPGRPGRAGAPAGDGNNNARGAKRRGFCAESGARIVAPILGPPSPRGGGSDRLKIKELQTLNV